jgi:hypothetical protein
MILFFAQAKHSLMVWAEVFLPPEMKCSVKNLGAMDAVQGVGCWLAGV